MSEAPNAVSNGPESVANIRALSNPGHDHVQVGRPGPGESKTVSLNNVTSVGFKDVALADVLIRLNGESIEFLFDNNGRITLEDIRNEAEGPSPRLQFASGEQFESRDIVEALVALTPPGGESSPAVQIEPTAGEVHGGGAGFSTFTVGSLASGVQITGAIGKSGFGSGGLSPDMLAGADQPITQEGNSAPMALDDTLTTDEDSPASVNVLANDGDANGNPLQLLGIDIDGLAGEFRFDADGTIYFDPAGAFESLGVGEHATQTVTYEVSDGAAISQGELTIRIDGVNDRPDTEHDDLYTTGNAPITFAASDLTENDFDADGDELTVIRARHAENGTVVLNDDGTITFTPDDGFVGDARFHYTVHDGNDGYAGQWVTVHVAEPNAAPTGTADRVITNIVDGSPILIPVDWLKANDFDPEGDGFNVINPVAGAGDSATLDGQGNIVFTPGSSPFDGGSLTYNLVDNGVPAATSDPVNVSISTTPWRNIRGSHDTDILLGGDRDDRINGRGGEDFIDGGDGNDRLHGGGRDDVLRGQDGNDIINGGWGNDLLLGGSGEDRLRGSNGDDILDGGTGNDLLIGQSGSDRLLISNLGDVDTIRGFQTGPGGDVIDLGSVLTDLPAGPGGDLDGHLRLTFDGDDTVIEIDADGGGDFASADAKVIVADIDLVGGNLDQSAVIDTLIDQGNLSVD